MAIIFDIETKTKGEPNPRRDKLEYIGFYDLDTKEYIIYDKSQRELIKKRFKKHKIIISYNGNRYDIPILKKEGLYTNNHISVDLYKVVKKRQKYIGLKYKSLSLENVAKILNLKERKQEDFNYDVLNKKNKTKKEIKYIKKYLNQDIKTTKNLYEFLYDFFKPFKEYVNDYNRKTMKWLTSSIVSYAYKAICNMCGLDEDFGNYQSTKKYQGGYVSKPAKQYANNVIIFDFSSIYPFTFAQCNLFSPQSDGWRNEKIGMKGHYNPNKQGKIEKLLMKLYKKRYKYKKEGDKRSYVIKIIINSLYGAAANPVFKSIYNRTAARDCTAIARYCIKTGIKIFTKLGYQCLYSDTDSIFVELNDKQNKAGAKHVAEYIVKTLQKEFLFKEDMFKFKIEDELKHIYFFKKNNRLLKKMYIYVTKDDEITIKGLPMIKNDSSKLGYHVFKKYMQKELIKGDRYFTYLQIKNWAYKEIKNDISIIQRTFTVKKKDWYANDFQLQAQISQKYGKGRHELIPNTKIGVGKSIKYCSLKDFKNNDLTFYDIDLSKFWKELGVFIKKMPKNSLIKATSKNQRLLEKWVKT